MLSHDHTVLHTRAATFRELHHGTDVLLVPNAWDAVTARLFARLGFRCIGTTSAAIAWALGYPDGERIPRAEMLDMVSRIAAATDLPVTADLESGYGEEPADVADAVRLAIAAGAVGVNIEDSTHDDAHPLFDLDRQIGRVSAAREAADANGVRAVVNARTDALVHSTLPAERRMDDVLARVAAYRDAGADCVFVLGIRDPAMIAQLVKRAGCPVNVLAMEGVPPVRELASLGVARVSVGPGFARAALSAAQRAATTFAQAGRYDDWTGSTLAYVDLNALMSEPPAA